MSSALKLHLDLSYHIEALRCTSEVLLAEVMRYAEAMQTRYFRENVMELTLVQRVIGDEKYSVTVDSESSHFRVD